MSFQEYVDDPYTKKITLYEVEARDLINNTTKILYLTDGNYFCTEPTDNPANINYEPRIKANLNFQSSTLPDFRSSSNSDIGFGVLTIANTDGEFDNWSNFSFNGRNITRKIGSPDWNITDFITTFFGTMQNVEQSGNSIKINVRGFEHVLNIPLQANIYDGSNSGATGDKGTKGNVKPIALGEVNNVTMSVSNFVGLRHQANDGAIEAITIYQNGLVLTDTVGYDKDLSTAIITQNVGTLDQITADIQGDKTGGIYYKDTGNIFRNLLTARFSGLSGIINQNSITTFISKTNKTIGVWIDYQTTLKEIRKLLFDGVGGYGIFRRDGQMYFDILVVPSGTATIELDKHNIKEISIEPSEIPVNKVTVNYARNYTIQTDQLAGSVSDARREYVGEDYKKVFSPVD